MQVLDFSLWTQIVTIMNKDPMPIRNVAQLQGAITRAFAQVSREQVELAIRDFPKRLKLCIAKQGGQFEYAKS